MYIYVVRSTNCICAQTRWSQTAHANVHLMYTYIQSVLCQMRHTKSIKKIVCQLLAAKRSVQLNTLARAVFFPYTHLSELCNQRTQSHNLSHCKLYIDVPNMCALCVHAYRAGTQSSMHAMCGSSGWCYCTIQMCAPRLCHACRPCVLVVRAYHALAINTCQGAGWREDEGWMVVFIIT